MRYALIGCGRIAPRHLDAAQSCRLEPVGLCDRESAKAEALAGGRIPTYTDHRALLWEAEPELVAVATDSGSHAAIARDCLEAGCHVLIEKPVALSLEEVDGLAVRARRNGLTVGVCHQNRFNAPVAALGEALAQNRLGRLLHGAAQIRWRRDMDYYAQADWRGRWQSDGGTLMNQCIHCIDLLRWALGPVVEVQGLLGNLNHPGVEAEDVGLALLRFESGALGLIEGSACVWPENLSETLSVFGDRGTVVLGGKSLERAECWRVAGMRPPAAETPPDVYGFGHRALYADLLDAIARGRPPLVGLPEGRAALEVVLAVYCAALTRHPVTLPLQGFCCADMAGFFTRGAD